MPDETKRLEELFKYFEATSNSIGNDIDAEPGYLPDLAQLSLDPVLNALTQLGTYRLDCDRAFVSIIDNEFQYVVAEATQSISLFDSKLHKPGNGLCIGARRLDLFAGVCAGTMPMFTGSAGTELICTSNIYADPTRYIINDFSAEDCYKDRPYVTGFPNMRYYAEVPIKSANGYVIGTYAVIDNQPRIGLSDQHYVILTEIAGSLMRHLEYVKLKEDHRQASSLLRGLNSFVQGDFKQPIETYGKERAGENSNLSSDKKSNAAVRVQNDANTFERPLSPEREIFSNDFEMEPTNKLSDKTFSVQATPMRTPSLGPNQQSVGDVRLSLDENLQSPGEAIGPQALKSDGLIKDPTPTKKLFDSSDDISTMDEVYVSFLRASHILRMAMELDGVMFLNANQSDLKSGNEARKDMVSFDTLGLLQSAPVTSEDEVSPLEKKWGTNPGRGSDLENSIKRPYLPILESRESMRMSGVLGYSTSKEVNPTTGVMSTDQFSLPEDLHLRLLRYYPRGSIFNLCQDRTPCSPSQDPFSTKLSSAEAHNESRKNSKTSASRSKRHREIVNHLRHYLPEAQYVLFMPLWNPHKGTWFAGSLGWTKNEKRALQSEDFAYFSVFGNTIMAEVTRLELLATDTAKSDFISSISHELRSPLHGILGSAEILKESSIDKEQRQMVGMVESCGRILLDTMDHILYFSKINSMSNQAKSHRQERSIHKVAPKVFLEQGSAFDLSLLVEETVESLLMANRSAQSLTESLSEPKHSRNHGPSMRRDDSDKIEDTGLNSVAVILRTETSPSWVIHSEPTAWRRVLMNLLGNALKYTETGFIEVILNTTNYTKASELDDFDSKICLAINDTGRGIGKTYLQTHLYTPFMQENSLSNGTGLGLSIVQKIVTSLGGTLEIQSEVGIGTQALASIPVISAKEQTSPILPNPEQYRESTLCLLGFDVYPDQGATALGSLSTPSKMLLSLKKTLRDYAEGWLMMKVTSIQNIDEVKSVQDHKVIAVCEQSLHLLEDKIEKGSKRIIVPANCSILVVCTSQMPNESSKRIQRDRVQYVTQPFGPRKLADALQSARQQSSTSAYHCLYQEKTFPPEAATGVSGIEQLSFEREPHELSPNSKKQNGIKKRTSSSSLKAVPNGTNTKPHVLLVEDNDINMNILVKYMTLLGCTYVTATNGKEALTTVSNNSSPAFDLILMDINMPIMDGFAATRAIRDWENSNELVDSSPVPIVALTGLGSAEAQQEAFTSGVDVFLTKPVKMATVRMLIEDGVERFLEEKH